MKPTPFLAALALALSFATASGATAPRTEVLPFLQDDYPRALADARSKKLPIFAEAWAPW